MATNTETRQRMTHKQWVANNKAEATSLRLRLRSQGLYPGAGSEHRLSPGGA